MIAPRHKGPYPEDVKLSKLLLVEGETPAHFFEALAVHLGINDSIEIRSFGSNSKLQASLAALVSGHGFSSVVKSLGIIRDAEIDADAARQSVNNAIANSKLPTEISRHVYILPDNARPGMIETLCLESVAHTPYFHCVEEFIANARMHGAVFPSGLSIEKSRLQVYMAAHPEPQLFPGIAASRGYWPFAEGKFDDLRTFLKSL